MKQFSNMRNCFFLLLLFTAVTARAQKISGMVRDAKSAPVSGASIAIKDSYDGTTADSAGRFSFTTTEKGKQVVTVSAIGYKPYEQVVTLEGGELALQVSLKEEITELKAV